MKKILFFSFFSILSYFSFAQSVVPLRGDTIRIYKQGGNAEIRIENSTRTIKGIATNVDGKGTINYIQSKIQGTSQIIIGLDTLTLPGGTPTNGLQLITGNVGLGGTLTQNTQILGAGFSYTLGGGSPIGTYELDAVTELHSATTRFDNFTSTYTIQKSGTNVFFISTGGQIDITPSTNQNVNINGKANATVLRLGVPHLTGVNAFSLRPSYVTTVSAVADTTLNITYNIGYNSQATLKGATGNYAWIGFCSQDFVTAIGQPGSAAGTKFHNYTAGFSALPWWSGSTFTLENMFGYFSGLATDSGLVQNMFDFYASEINTVGSTTHNPRVTNHYAYYVEAYTKATNNYGFVIVGNQPSGFGVATPKTQFETTSFASASRSVTTNRTLDITDATIIIPSGTPVITLPAASTCPGRIYNIVNQTGSTVTISTYVPKAGGTSTGILTATALWLKSDNTNWNQINN